LNWQKRSKYNNVITKTEDGTFRSKAEHRRWLELKLLLKAGEIYHLTREMPIPLHARSGELVGKYRADFVYSTEPEEPFFNSYEEARNGTLFFEAWAIVEDVKGGKMRTALYKWKAKHFKAEYGFSITEVEK
jgi:hypothetical protein